MAVDADLVAAELDRGLTLPASWYADPEVLRREHERIFRRSWQYVGRLDQLAETGSYFTATVGAVPVLVVRGAGGELNGLVNVCRHRGHLVAAGEGCRGTLQCPYHAWTYGLDGALRKAPRSEREPGFDPADYALLPVAVDSWGPFVFANPDPGAAPLAAALGELPEVIASCGLDVSGLRFRERVAWEQRCNWKVGIENYLECYHCAVAHPGLAKLVDVRVDAYALEAHETFSVQTGPVREAALDAGGGSAPYSPRGPIDRAQWSYLWPNMTVNIEPGEPNLSIDVWQPDGTGRTRGVTDYFFGAGVSEAAARAILDFSRQTGEEDQDLVENVQRGLESGMVPHGRLLLSSEHLIQHFQRLVQGALAGI